MKEKFTRIWLQINEFPETTWCRDKINDDDVEYVLASEVQKALDMLEEHDISEAYTHLTLLLEK